MNSPQSSNALRTFYTQMMEIASRQSEASANKSADIAAENGSFEHLDRAG
jgi:hypothetical protein